MKISDEIKEHSISEHIGKKEDYYEYIKESKEELVEEITKRIISEIKREKNNVINNIYVKEIEEEEEEEEVIDNKIQWAPIIVVILIGMFFLFILVYFTSNSEISDNSKVLTESAEEKVVLVTPVTDSIEENEELRESMEKNEVEHSNVIESLFSFTNNSTDIQSIDFKAFEKSVKKSIIDILDKVKESLE